MDVFYRQYNIYRILLSVLGLWPYHKLIYSKIHRISISVIMLAYIVFQVLSLFKSGITFRGCIVTLSATCPVAIYFMRYVTSVAMFPVTKYIFDNLRTINTTLKDQLEVQILMKYVDYSTYIIFIFLLLCCLWILFATSFVFTPITLDLLLPLNESRRRYFSYFTMFSHDRIEYLDVACVNILVVHTIGMLSLAGTELTLVLFAHYMCGLFDITSYRMRKTIAGLSSSKQIDPNFRDFRHVVDSHTNTLQLIDYALSNYMVHYLPPCSVFLVSFSVCLHRLSNAVTNANDQTEIFISSMFVISHIVLLYVCHYSGQILIDHSLDVFKETYNSTWYCMPVEAQKLLLFIMLRSSTESVIDLFGFFAASHVGFSKMLSTSFSYFTMIYSLQ
ncbi:uncharacterized protein LOC126914708 isoform X2 [Bombus affinis]|uniref:uncharacterized protein LOC126914708 isoform X2 n=1 Tax=Bombus affinis TaxID=309941 RepID=UPI0021B7F432|nr:uncharacterized protein LOC126914708 isoform X2 [Bombus affinis]